MRSIFQKPLTPIDFAARRAAFLKRLGRGIAVFPSASELVRNHDVTHAFRQDSNFYYLSGFDEADSALILAPHSKTPFQMFVRPRDKTRELWEGKIIGPEGAKAEYGADVAHPSSPESYFDEAFLAALADADAIYYRVGLNEEWDRRMFGLFARGVRKLGRTGRPFWPIHDPNEILGEMRLVKSKAEIERLDYAAQLSAEAHTNAMRMAKPGMFEYEVEAVLHHAFRARGSARVGYGSIVASGPNACVLHYHANSRRMADRDLLLIDAGAEFDYYTADITRVFPVNGRFTVEQREVYSSVLKVQKELVRLVKPGRTLRELHETAVELLTEELRALRVLKGPTKQLVKKKEYFSYYPHGTGHWLGMDVHDAGRYYAEKYENPRKLQAGMVHTIEPGLYFGPEAPARLRGIGVRIEDDVLVTSDGHRVLTSGVPKEIDEIESICSQG